ncbi:MarR family winged helix-turn-helix transcriptional regulator [Actinomadura opuntiae]|uniref:MarR family winged helix-turn-helix transcriptional regulator n=1 Tax=Actinomadura sp. OS1-43 TaxID=604315 RepID=UPI00255B2331|nr:MarR family transcriptional regulator [Actinomadura sp. OS1-43]MDL4820065.1 MarR family transcriptional regulator [Actinomadura sp. OS1-43]
MPPREAGVTRLIDALFAVLGNMQRARKAIPDAAALAVLQVIGAAQRDDPHEGVRPSQIADHLEVHRSAVTHQLKALTEAGYITAAPDPADRRASILTLTDAGRETVDRLTRQGRARFASFVADWTDDEVTELARLLEKFRASAQAVNEKEPPPSAPGWKSR